MHKAILIACVPCMIALITAFVLLWAVIRISGARWNWKRLGEVHACQDGGVQSLAFVLTLPVFLIIVLFIVQVSQLMIGTMIVNYAAFAAARAACVWIPSELEGTIPSSFDARFDPENTDDQNQLPFPITSQNPVLLDTRTATTNLKYQKIFQAAALAVAPACPSQNFGFSLDQSSGPTANAVIQFYDLLAPQTATNPRVPSRLNNKIAYAYQNTVVRVEFRDKDKPDGPTYKVARVIDAENETYYDVWDDQEVGWEDPITVTVTHHFGLIPGPGRLLAKFLVRADGRPDVVSPRIEREANPGAEQLYTTPIWASATMTNEGFKSLVPYVHTNSH